MVARLLHSSSEKHGLPWHRVINSQGRISLTGDAYELQRALLQSEGIEFGPEDTVDLAKYA
jgi:methylated-DNA-protein-cysteine methyltransferase-like protein